MPPQGYVILGGVGMNYVASRLGRPTISRWCARHKAATFTVTAGAVAWWSWHIATYVLPAVVAAIDDTRPNLPEE